MVEDAYKYRMSVDYPRLDKTSVSTKFTAAANTQEEFEKVYNYLKAKAMREAGYM